MIKWIANKLYTFLTRDQIVEVVYKEVTVQVISKEAFAKLQGRLPNPMIGASDTDTVAAHKLGVQMALREIEKGIVV